jgi:predicted metalloprotease with PDZ domain
MPIRLAVVLALLGASAASAQPHVTYRLSFPEPQHRWMQVEATWSALPPGPLELRMSRSSPGRYAPHEFAKNVFEVTAFDGRGRQLPFTRPNPHQWDVAGHDGTVRVVYRIYGDRVDGTYLGIDATHAHINMPAALMWGRGLDLRPARVVFVQPAGSTWQVATQLFPTDDPLTFTAPNLQYLMDSPAEFSNFVWRSFRAPQPAGESPPLIRIALHHAGTDAEADQMASDALKIVAEARAVFGEYPAYDTGSYTFLADYLPYVDGDGMEHRNSTVVSSSRSLSGARLGLLGTVAHEYFHGWNVERIRPRALEPFNFEDANMTGELWLAEGVTNYYEQLLLVRSGLQSLEQALGNLTGTVNTVLTSPATRFRSAEDMSRLAPFTDAARSVDRTYWSSTFISYYTFGEALGLGLDLMLRDRSNGSVTLDDFMRAMWRKHGKPGGTRPGYVDAPYTVDDVRARLTEVSGSASFADDFVRRHVQGREPIDYARLLLRPGLVLKRRFPGRASLGALQLDPTGTRLKLMAPPPIGSAAYRAGLSQDDEMLAIDGARVSSLDQLNGALTGRKPGDRVLVTFVRRDGAEVKGATVLDEDSQREIVTVESAGGRLDAEQRAFREAWLGSRAEDALRKVASRPMPVPAS